MSAILLSQVIPGLLTGTGGPYLKKIVPRLHLLNAPMCNIQDFARTLVPTKLCLGILNFGVLNPHTAGVFGRTRAAEGGGRFCPLPNSWAVCRSNMGEAAIENS